MSRGRRASSSSVTNFVRAGISLMVVVAFAYALLSTRGHATTQSSHVAVLASSQRSARSGIRECSANDLKVALTLATGAAGTGLYSFTATNVGQTTCDLDGFFGFAIFGADNKLLTNSTIRKWTTPEGEKVTKRPIELRPSGKATTTVSLGENPVNGAITCPLIKVFRLTPPDTTRAIRIARGHLGTGWFCQPTGSRVIVYATTSEP